MNELQKFFKERRISTKQIAEVIGYCYGYTKSLLNGNLEMTNKARARLEQSFPDAKPYLDSTYKDVWANSFDYLKQVVEDLRVHPTNACIEWPFCRHSDGYGNFQFGGKCLKAHRMAFELYHGKAATQSVLHRCDSPACFNPLHLYEGTQKQNRQDWKERGTSKFTLARKAARAR